jgi:hypothetical protein
MYNLVQDLLDALRVMRDQVNPVIAGYNQEVLASKRDNRNANFQAALASFCAFLRQAILELSRLAAELRERTGQHTDLGEITFLAQAIQHVSHDPIHSAQIAVQLEGAI